LTEDEAEVSDSFPSDDSWILSDFIQSVGEHRNLYAKEKYNMVVMAKLVKRDIATRYSISKKDTDKVFQELDKAGNEFWGKGEFHGIWIFIFVPSNTAPKYYLVVRRTL
jgi:hypothetical protein